MHNVTLKYKGKEYKGGLVQSELDYGIWLWNFYESSQLKWSLTNRGDLKEDAKIFKEFSVDRIRNSGRNDREVNITYRPRGREDLESYCLVFASKKDAMIFNGEANGQ